MLPLLSTGDAERRSVATARPVVGAVGEDLEHGDDVWGKSPIGPTAQATYVTYSEASWVICKTTGLFKIISYS
jgi:hypothetical protein